MAARVGGGSKRVAFVHPDLGIGGAERLVVDAAVALKAKGHTVKFFTNHHDRNHCFPETREELEVEVVADWIPRSIFGRAQALLAYLRMIVCALYLTLFSSYSPDVIICDQISAAVPFLRSPVIFYCHFPDQLLTGRESWIKRWYRAPLDWFEEWTTGKADKVVVNSRFTGGIFRDTFTSLSLTPDVLYPSLNTQKFDAYYNEFGPTLTEKKSGKFTFLSINRYENKKNLKLAVLAFADLLHKNPSYKGRTRLILAGGHDPRVLENLRVHSDLTEIVREDASLQLDEDVILLKSPSDSKKFELLYTSDALLYTPDKEHFGIVPVEAMHCGLPVVAVNSGGPLETVKDDVTGYLVPGDMASFSSAMFMLINEGEDFRQTMGRRGKERVKEKFSFMAFANQLDKIVQSV